VPRAMGHALPHGANRPSPPCKFGELDDAPCSATDESGQQIAERNLWASIVGGSMKLDVARGSRVATSDFDVHVRLIARNGTPSGPVRDHRLLDAIIPSQPSARD